MTKTLRLDVPLLLPEVPDARDACVTRLEALIDAQRGIGRTRLTAERGAKCHRPGEDRW